MVFIATVSSMLLLPGAQLANVDALTVLFHPFLQSLTAYVGSCTAFVAMVTPIVGFLL
jgi:hypothetical protein